MYNHRYSTEQVAKGEAISSQKNKAIGEIKDEFLVFLRDECQEGFEEVLHSDVVLVICYSGDDCELYCQHSKACLVCML